LPSTQAIVGVPSAYDAGKAAAWTTLRLIREAHRDGALQIFPRELPWRDRLQRLVEQLPTTATEFITQMMAQVDTSKFTPSEYGIV
jgi:hypothetical protein